MLTIALHCSKALKMEKEEKKNAKATQAPLRNLTVWDI